MSYHDEQMRKRCEESSTHPSSKGHIPTFHGPMFPCEKCKELEAERDRLRKERDEVQEKLDSWNDLAADQLGLRRHVVAKKCAHGKGFTDYCEPCGRVHSV